MQDETSNQNCVRFLRASVYVSSSASALDGLPTIAANTRSDPWTVSSNVVAVPLTITRSGLFGIKLQRREMVNGASKRLTDVSSGVSKRLEPGTNSPQNKFNPGRTVTVHAFPDDNPGSCFARCEPNLPGCTVAYQELEYKVLVDGGNTSQGEVLESNQSDDEGDPMGRQPF